MRSPERRRNYGASNKLAVTNHIAPTIWGRAAVFQTGGQNRGGINCSGAQSVGVECVGGFLGGVAVLHGAYLRIFSGIWADFLDILRPLTNILLLLSYCFTESLLSCELVG